MSTPDDRRPPGPFRPRFWRSPIRGTWLTAALGLVLLLGVPVLFVTGLLSYVAYNPGLPHNDTTGASGLLRSYLFSWPTSPTWLYRVTQGTHVTLGLVLVPVLLAKLWSVIPKLFTWPPVSSATISMSFSKRWIPSKKSRGSQIWLGRELGQEELADNSFPLL